MTKNLLDLREKGMNKVRTVERIIFKPRSFKFEMFRMLSVVFIVTVIGFGISNADDIPIVKEFINPSPKEITELKPLNIRGYVSAKESDSFTLSDTGDSSGKLFPYNVILNQLPVVIDGTAQDNTVFITDTKQDITFDDIEIGHVVVVRSSYDESDPENLFAYKVTLLTMRDKITQATTTIDMILATTTDATSTDETINASTTDATTTDATTTEEEITNSTSTDESAEQTTTEKIIETFQEIVDGVSKTFQVILNTLTGETSTTTVDTVIEENPAPEEEAPATEEESSQEETQTDTTEAPVVEEVIEEETAEEVVEEVVEEQVEQVEESQPEPEPQPEATPEPEQNNEE